MYKVYSWLEFLLLLQWFLSEQGVYVGLTSAEQVRLGAASAPNRR